MGRKGKRKGGGGNKRGRDNKQDNSKGSWAGDKTWITLDPEADTKRFHAYYASQGLFEEKEWPEVRASLLTELPTTFRINPMSGDAEALLAALNSEHGFGLRGKHYTYENVEIKAPVPLPWYPNNMAWQMTVPKNGLKKCPEVQEFRQWLMEHDREGGLNRQEAVSMIPTVLLEVQPHHNCLDMCAAPGSKTSQLVSDLHRIADPPGMVVANDADAKRAYMLTHQLRRLGSPNVVITTHDAQSFPTMHKFGTDDDMKEVSSSSGAGGGAGGGAGAGAGSTDTSKPVVAMYFDRVLCDVPCSGDGTLRKNMPLWRKWHENMGNQLHQLQLQISVRGARLLKVGGTMVYSTCSLNPIENEAVVAELLRRSNGALEVVDVSDKLPGLKRRPGLTKWKVYDTQHKMYDLASEVPADRFFDRTRKYRKGVNLRHSMFSPTEEENTRFHLDRCVRVLPHDQDTGGFFITLLRKTKTSNFDLVTDKSEEALEEQEAGAAAAAATSGLVAGAADASSAVAMTDTNVSTADTATGGDTSTGAPAADAEAGAGAGAGAGADASAPAEEALSAALHGCIPGLDDSFNLIADDIDANIREFYGLTHDVLPPNLLFGRSGAATPRKIYLLSRSISDCLLTRRNQKLHLVHAGAHFLERNTLTKDCPFRIVQDGVYMALPLLIKAKSPQLITLKFQDFLKLLREHHLKPEDFSDPGARTALQKAKVGCVVWLLLNPDGSMPDVSSPTSQQLGVVACAGLLSPEVGMGKSSIQREEAAGPDGVTGNIARVMVTKEDKVHLEGLMALRNPELAADIRQRRQATLQAAQEKAAAKAESAQNHEQKRRKRMENQQAAQSAAAASGTADAVEADVAEATPAGDGAMKVETSIPADDEDLADDEELDGPD